MNKARSEVGKLHLGAHLLEPIKAIRLRYLPLLMVYFAYGALGIVDISRDLWVKESLSRRRN